MPTFTYSNHYLSERNKGSIDWLNDAISVRLMASAFAFDKDAHAVLANWSASELAAGNGYTAGGKTLQNVAVSEDDTNDRSDVTADPDTWTAAGGNIGPTPGAMYHDNTANITIGFLAFDQEETATDGNDLALTHPTFRSVQA